MSFLLLKSRSGRSSSQGRQRGTTNTSTNGSRSNVTNRNARNPPVAAASSSSSRLNQSRQGQRGGLANPNANATVASGHGQVQLHRYPTPLQRAAGRGQQELSQRSGQVSQRMGRQQDRQVDTLRKEQQQQGQNEVICMDEVMEDLRILERQQHESQRHLESIKLSKQHKLQHQAALEKKLSALKYSTGESKAELLRSREVLSTCNRELGQAKLLSTKHTENLKRFDADLKRCIAVVRGLYVKRRRVAEGMVRLRQTHDEVVKRKEKAFEELESTRMQLEAKKHEEQLLIKSTQAAKIRCQNLASEVSKVRSEIPALEEDLAAAQEIESSTKLRMETLESEIQSENERHEKVIAETDIRITEKLKKKDELDARLKVMNMEIIQIDKDLNDAWEKCKGYQQEEGHEISTSVEDAKLDLVKVQQSVDSAKAELHNQEEENKAIENNMHTLKVEIASLQEQTKAKRDEATKLFQTVEEERKIEEERTTEHTRIATELDDERKKLQELKCSVEELEKESHRVVETASYEAEKKRLQINEAEERLDRTTIASLVMDSTLKLVRFENSKKAEAKSKRIQDLKSEAEKAKTNLECVQVEYEEFTQTYNAEKEKEMQDVVDEHQKFMDDNAVQVSKLIAQYPYLKDFVNGTDNPDQSLEDQIHAALADLRSTCDERIRKAQQQRDERVQSALKQKQEEIDQRKRLEEEARKEREEQLHIETEARKRREEEEARLKRIEEEKEVHRQKEEKRRADDLKRRVEAEKRHQNEILLKKRLEKEARRKLQEEEEVSVEATNEKETGVMIGSIKRRRDEEQLPEDKPRRRRKVKISSVREEFDQTLDNSEERSFTEQAAKRRRQEEQQHREDRLKKKVEAEAAKRALKEKKKETLHEVDEDSGKSGHNDEWLKTSPEDKNTDTSNISFQHEKGRRHSLKRAYGSTSSTRIGTSRYGRVEDEAPIHHDDLLNISPKDKSKETSPKLSSSSMSSHEKISNRRHSSKRSGSSASSTRKSASRDNCIEDEDQAPTNDGTPLNINSKEKIKQTSPKLSSTSRRERVSSRRQSSKRSSSSASSTRKSASRDSRIEDEDQAPTNDTTLNISSKAKSKETLPKLSSTSRREKVASRRHSREVSNDVTLHRDDHAENGDGVLNISPIAKGKGFTSQREKDAIRRQSSKGLNKSASSGRRNDKDVRNVRKGEDTGRKHLANLNANTLRSEIVSSKTKAKRSHEVLSLGALSKSATKSTKRSESEKKNRSQRSIHDKKSDPTSSRANRRSQKSKPKPAISIRPNGGSKSRQRPSKGKESSSKSKTSTTKASTVERNGRRKKSIGSTNAKKVGFDVDDVTFSFR